MLFSSVRQFKVWDYNVSHRQLLLRSPATPEVAGNVDVVFWQVDYLCVPTVMDGIRIETSPDSDQATIDPVMVRAGSSVRYCIDPGEKRHFVLAGGFKVLNNDLDIFDSTLVYFGIDRPVEWYGKVVAHS